RDIDVVGQTDLFLISYASQADFLSDTGFTQTALPQSIAGNFSLGGFSVDPLGGWHLIFERDIDVVGQTDLFLISYASQADFLSDTGFTQTAMPQSIAGNFSLGGFYIGVSAPPPNGVPEPGSMPLLALAVAMLWLFGRLPHRPICRADSIGSST
ncbi:MAG TPA: hypothetical protein PKZ27_16010, partial [Rhodocyclaceae bacterium]|nr:hypothetical protein [Rhodocyclaceae bacterium]